MSRLPPIVLLDEEREIAERIGASLAGRPTGAVVDGFYADHTVQRMLHQADRATSERVAFMSGVAVAAAAVARRAA